MVCHAIEQVQSSRAHALETQIKRFAKSHQRRLRKFAKVSSRLGDILYTFPAAAFALVSGHADHNRRGHAVHLIKEGRSLKQVAAVLDLPWWVRRLPPEAFTGPLDLLPDGERFNQKVGNCIPKQDAAAAVWLAWLRAGYGAGNEDFAIWLARQKFFRSPHLGEAGGTDAPVLPLAIYAWFSSLDEDHRGRRMIARPWHQEMQLGTAVVHTRGWFEQVLVELTGGNRNRGPGRYSKRKQNRGYTFVALRTAQELVVEGEAMDHCVGTYAGAVAQGHCAIFSVRLAGRRVATLEVGPGYGRGDALVVRQLQGCANAPVARDVIDAVANWLQEHQGFIGTRGAVLAGMAFDETRWRAFWGHYIAEKGDLVQVPERPNGRLVWELARDVELLTRYVQGH